MPRYSLDLTTDEVEELRRMADEDDRSMASMMRVIFKRGLHVSISASNPRQIRVKSASNPRDNEAETALDQQCPSPARAREQCGSPYEDIRTTVTDADILALWKNEEPFKRLKDPGKMLAKLKASRPTLNHMEVSNDVILWWEANPAKRKTDKGLTRFLAGWWMRQKNGSEPTGSTQGKPQQTELTAGWNRNREEQPHERRERENKKRQLATPEEILRVTKDLV